MLLVSQLVVRIGHVFTR